MAIESIEINLKTQNLSGFYPDRRGTRLSLLDRLEWTLASKRALLVHREASHRIRAIIGRGLNLKKQFSWDDVPRGKLWTREIARLEHPERDWILARILWLCGNEMRFQSRRGQVDTPATLYLSCMVRRRSEPMGVTNVAWMRSHASWQISVTWQIRSSSQAP